MRTSPRKPGRNCTSFTSTILRPPVITESLQTKREVSRRSHSRLTYRQKVLLLDSTIALLTNRVIDRALGTEVSPRSLRQWAEYWIHTSRWHTTPPRAIPHGMEGRRGRRTSVTTKRGIPSNSSRTSLEKGGGGVTPDILVYTILRSKLNHVEQEGLP